MNIKPAISIIIPIYNSEEFLLRCLESVATQDFKENYEVILIDDGSTDNSGEICDKFVENNTNFTVYHVPNNGVSSARNYGLDKAIGEFVMFVDSDDEIPSDCLSNLYSPKADFVVGGSIRIEDCKKTTYAPEMDKYFDINHGVDFIPLLSTTVLFDGPCAKLYRRTIILNNNLSFNKALSYAEDKLFVYTFLTHAESFKVVSKNVYHQIKRSNSLSSVTNSDNHVKQLMVFLPLYLRTISILKEKYPCETIQNYYHNDIVLRYVFRILNIFEKKRCSSLRYKNVAYISKLLNKDVLLKGSINNKYINRCVSISNNLGAFALYLYLKCRLLKKDCCRLFSISYNFKYYYLLPKLMSVSSRRFRRWVMKKYHVQIGKGTIVCKNVQFRSGYNICIGNGCVINSNVLLDGRGGKIIIGDNVDIAQDAIIWTMGHNPQTHEAKTGNVTIGDYCWIGCRAMIMPNTVIGESSICAAYAVVTKNVDKNSIYGGVPAHKICDRNRQKDYILSYNSKYR